MPNQKITSEQNKLVVETLCHLSLEKTCLFEIHTPTQTFKIYSNGQSEGFPEGAILINHFTPEMNLLIAKLIKDGGLTVNKRIARRLFQLSASSTLQESPPCFLERMKTKIQAWWKT